MGKRRWIRFFGMWLGMWLGGFLMGFGLLLGLQRVPEQKQMWLNPDSGHLVWTDRCPSGEFISFDKLRSK